MNERLCPICNLPRKIETLQFSAKHAARTYPTWEGHEKCEEELRRREEERQRAQWDGELIERRLQNGFETSGVNWSAKNFDSFTANHNAKARAMGWKYPDKGVVFHGAPGSGKTHLMAAMAQRIAREDKKEFRFFKVAPWLDWMYAVDFAEKERAITVLEQTPVLFIDDIGAEKLTEWGEAKIERILDARFEFSLPTFCSTNLTPEGLKSYLTPRSWSRLSGLCDFVLLTGRDNRQAVKRVNGRHVA